MKDSAIPAHVTLNWLAHCAGMHFNTVKKRLEGMVREKDGKFDRVKALGRLYIGDHGEVTYSEAMKGLALARKEQVELANECTRKTRIPIEDVMAVSNEAFQAIAGIIKTSGLPLKSINEIFALIRQVGERMLSSTVDSAQVIDEHGFSPGNGSSLPDFGDGAQPPH